MTFCTQLRAARAIDDVANGRSVKAASKIHQVERTYLRRRLQGVPTREEINEARQILSKKQEDSLTRWIVVQGRLDYAPPHAPVPRVRATRASQHRAIPRFEFSKGRTIDYRRLNGATVATGNVLFDRLELKEVKRILSRNRWNADEFGAMEGMGENSPVLGDAFRKFILLKDTYQRRWISVITCVSADGRALPPLIIFAGANVQQQWFPNTEDQPYEYWYFTTSQNGWTNTEIGLKWLKEVFIPHTKPAHPSEWRLLIVDGHNSHTTEEFMWTCLTNKIYIIFLPSHSSHAWQPLDVGVLSVLKRRFRVWFRERCYGRASEATDKTDFLWALSMAWNEVMMTSRCIIKGFKASGIWPVNRKLALSNPYVKESPGTEKVSALQSSQPIQPPDLLERIASLAVKTPKTSRDINIIREILTKMDSTFGKPTARLLFRKIGRALDEPSSKLTAAENHNSQLTSALERAGPKKRKKVEADPNQEFVRLKDVRQVKARMEGHPTKRPIITRRDEAEDKEEENDTESLDPNCIVVRLH